MLTSTLVGTSSSWAPALLDAESASFLRRRGSGEAGLARFLVTGCARARYLWCGSLWSGELQTSASSGSSSASASWRLMASSRVVVLMSAFLSSSGTPKRVCNCASTVCVFERD